MLQRVTRAVCRSKMPDVYEGVIAVKDNELNLDLTLLGGQSFRWEKCVMDGGQPEWRGVAYSTYWVITQTTKAISFKAYPATATVAVGCNAQHFHKLLYRYLRLEDDLLEHVARWRAAHKHFERIASHMKAVRVLAQEPLENMISFICSQNNNIKRISAMIEWLCRTYGYKIGQFQDREVFTFPSLPVLMAGQDKLEVSLRNAKFGYRAKFIADSVTQINENGGDKWFDKLRTLPYAEARQELVKLPGIGFKVADCVCLMSLNHLEAVPIDTHMFQIAQRSYMPQLAAVKTVSTKTYEEIAHHFRQIYGLKAGWAQAILFCSELQQFQSENTGSQEQPTAPTVKSKKRKK